ncbi:MAG: DUF1552 domain-containing protein [Myxococcales bacterium]|jgi:hypothetical protein|nr:DUF1552 domain-containing protein [Myxococcales bacterium]
MSMNRRALLRFFASSAMTLPFAGLLARSSEAGVPTQTAKRFVVFYFPDGVPEPGPGGGKWHPSGSDTSFTLGENLQPLAPFASRCAFLKGLSMGPTDAGSHPGGAKKLLTGVDGGGGESIDRYLARTVGAGAPYKHLYLGAMAAQNSASGDKFVSYPSAGTTAAPEDNPVQAFARLFGGATPGGGGAPAVDPTQVSVVDTALADLNDLRARLGDAERAKLDLHLEGLRDVERRVKGLGGQALPSCDQSLASLAQVDTGKLYEAAEFPDVLRAQIDVMVQAMACGLTKVGVIQASQHTSELIMSRFAGTPLYKPGFDMRSHQASHYGQSSDPKFADYVAQRTWFVSQFAYLLDQLAQRPEGAGTMLDNSIVLLCTEVGEGNTHTHDQMPFVLAGRAGGSLRTGRVFDFGYRRHSDLLVTIANAMGDGLTSFGQASAGGLPGVLA